MDPATVTRELIAVLEQIQTDSGLECPPLTGATIPVDDIPGFNSKIWPVATTILAIKINATIPNDVNIFVDEKTKIARSIEDIAVFVSDLVMRQGQQGATST